MAVKDVTVDRVEAAIEEFHRTGLEAMLEKYGGGPSTKWYLEVGSARYDQKLVVRAAHVLQGLGNLPPLVPGRFHGGALSASPGAARLSRRAEALPNGREP